MPGPRLQVSSISATRPLNARNQVIDLAFDTMKPPIPKFGITCTEIRVEPKNTRGLKEQYALQSGWTLEKLAPKILGLSKTLEVE